MQNLIRAIAILGLCILMIVMRTAVGAESGSGAGAVTAERIARAGSDPEQWLTTGRDQAGSYYSPLADINRSNVGHLGFAWDYKLGTHRGVESTPLVVDGAMYVVGNMGMVYALDARNGKLLWQYSPDWNHQVARSEGNDVISRGIVVWNGKVYVVTPDCRLIALKASDGSLVWEVPTLTGNTAGYVCSGVPQLAGDVIVVGNSGGDSSPGGHRGYVSAFDLATGAVRWRFYTVPSLHDQNPTPEMAAAEKTWSPTRDPSFGGGGMVWDGTAYDPTLRLIYIGTGNAAPYGAARAATGTSTDNLYAASIVALHADSGRLAWYYQTTPGDRWDFDADATFVLADLEIGGQKRAVIMQANKNGYFYVIDRSTGKPISAVPFATINWADGMDKNFRPVVASNADWSSAPKLIYPSVQGAHSWPPMAFSPQTGLVYIPTNDVPNFLINLKSNPGATVSYIDEATVGTQYVMPDKSYDPKDWQPIVGALPPVPAANPATGKPLLRASIKALDPLTGRVVWEQDTSQDYLLTDGGTLATGGGLVFAGREDGVFLAYDARTGSVLKSLTTGTAMMTAPMTYKLDGLQYVAILAGHGGSWIASFTATAGMKYLNDTRVLVFKVGGKEVPLPELRHTEPYTKPPSVSLDPAQMTAGMRLFNVYCARCHALGVPGVTPDLSRLNHGIGNKETFDAIVLKGAYLPLGMARFDDVLTPADADAIHAYLIDESGKAYKAQSVESSTH